MEASSGSSDNHNGSPSGYLNLNDDPHDDPYDLGGGDMNFNEDLEVF